MSSGKRINRNKAENIAIKLLTLLYGTPTRLCVAGSIRRKSETVGDIEIVALPSRPELFYQRLDALLHAGKIQHASNKSWGLKLRRFIFERMKCEIYITDKHNFGYRYWMCSGPSDANRKLMDILVERRSIIRFNGGYAWRCTYKGDEVTYKHKLSIPSEDIFFKLFGMDYVYPRWRSAALYQSYINTDFDLEYVRSLTILESKQKAMF